MSTTAGPPAELEDYTDEQLAQIAPIMNAAGSIDLAVVQALADRDPRTFTAEEAVAMYIAVLFLQYRSDQPLASISVENYGSWLEALVEVVGGTLTSETKRGGEVVERSVRRYRGRKDVRRFHARAKRSNDAPRARTGTRSREHRPAAARRTSSSSTTSSADPGDDDSEPARICSSCGEEIDRHKEPRARTCARCRKRKQRDKRQESWLDLIRSAIEIQNELDALRDTRVDPALSLNLRDAERTRLRETRARLEAKYADQISKYIANAETASVCLGHARHIDDRGIERIGHALPERRLLLTVSDDEDSVCLLCGRRVAQPSTVDKDAREAMKQPASARPRPAARAIAPGNSTPGTWPLKAVAA